MKNDVKKLLIAAAGAVTVPLLLTALALWQWKPGAPMLAVVLLLGAVALVYDLVAKRKLNSHAYRFALGIAILTVLALLWMNVAVGGILGDNPANMMYFGVLITGLAGAVIARLEAVGMAFALFAMAFAIVLIPIIAWAIGTPAFANGFPAVMGLHAGFALLFCGSGTFFLRAARGQRTRHMSTGA
ncbi:hypothetical protein GCM10010967_32080 [Dyadobacter beijingensis]|uniref:Uncharacterized protein n=1 Tax=Dyadobacter beijingensis TaxID=365489 RepID=A0ABQ2I1F0_9BACT|nr:hypothetical protein [Dyadobacter beijingensis]GGM96123.1 hypothetical protein GCM10010967_32080 [Dyadobacter beijingensis]